MQFPKYNYSKARIIKPAVILTFASLLLLGVYVGQHVIEEQCVKKALNDILFLEGQYYTYQQNYGFIPGDDATASQRFTNVSDGNNDGVLQGGAFDVGIKSAETSLIWQHLRASGLLKHLTETQFLNPFGGRYGFQTGAFTGANIVTSTVFCLDGVPASAAHRIDSELDDGEPRTGRIMSSLNGINGETSPDYTISGLYVLCLRL